jgi:hypothetical protein
MTLPLLPWPSWSTSASYQQVILKSSLCKFQTFVIEKKRPPAAKEFQQDFVTLGIRLSLIQSYFILERSGQYSDFLVRLEFPGKVYESVLVMPSDEFVYFRLRHGSRSVSGHYDCGYAECTQQKFPLILYLDKKVAWKKNGGTCFSDFGISGWGYLIQRQIKVTALALDILGCPLFASGLGSCNYPLRSHLHSIRRNHSVPSIQVLDSDSFLHRSMIYACLWIVNLCRKCRYLSVSCIRTACHIPCRRHRRRCSMVVPRTVSWNLRISMLLVRHIFSWHIDIHNRMS